MKLIDDAVCDAAVEYLNGQADAAAQAYADRDMAKYYREAKRAELMLQAPYKTQGLREAWAESHADYLEVCRQEAQAVKEVRWHQHQMARATTVLDVWRSQNARERGFARIG